MNHKPLLSIGDFAVTTTLSAQTLRYYHSEGLLVPVEVDERTGYRGYTFEQVHRALLIVALRGAGVSIRGVRAVLDTPDLLPEVLREHQLVLDRRRSQENDAMVQARRLAEGWPTADERRKPATTAVGRRVPGEAVDAGGAVVPPRVRAAAVALHRELVDAGVGISGPAWCQYALDTAQDKAKVLSPEGPDWTVAVDLQASKGALQPLPAGSGLLDCPSRRELVVHLAGAPTMVVFAAALEHLSRTSLEKGLVPDLGRPRYVLEGEHVRLALSVDSA